MTSGELNKNSDASVSHGKIHPSWEDQYRDASRAAQALIDALPLAERTLGGKVTKTWITQWSDEGRRPISVPLMEIGNWLVAATKGASGTSIYVLTNLDTQCREEGSAATWELLRLRRLPPLRKEVLEELEQAEPLEMNAEEIEKLRMARNQDAKAGESSSSSWHILLSRAKHAAGRTLAQRKQASLIDRIRRRMLERQLA